MERDAELNTPSLPAPMLPFFHAQSFFPVAPDEPRGVRDDAERPTSISSVTRKKPFPPASSGFPRLSFLLLAIAVATCVNPLAVSAAAASSPLRLSASVSSPLELSARRPDAVTAVVAFNNSGASAVDWLVTSSVSWLSFDTANFGSNLAAGANAAVTVRASAAGLTKGAHSALLAFGVAGGEELLLPVTLTVTPPLEVSPATVTESCALGTTATVTVTVTNRASTSVTWSSAASEAWIVASPSSVTTLAGGGSVTVTLTLGAGLGTQATHDGSLALADDAHALSEVAARVTLTTRLVSGGNTVYAANSAGIVGKLNGTSWIGLGSGLSATTGVPPSGSERSVSAMAVDAGNGILYVGGVFVAAGGVAGTSMLAKWDIHSSTWSALGSGVTGGAVLALALDLSNNVLYVGGRFESAGGGIARTARLAKWDIASSTWSAVGGGLQEGFMGLATFQVNALTFDGERKALYVGGQFKLPGADEDVYNPNLGKYNLVKWDVTSSTWSGLGLYSSLNRLRSYETVSKILIDTLHNTVHVYEYAGTESDGNFWIWDISSSTWSRLGSGEQNPFHSVSALSENSVTAGSRYVGASKWRLSDIPSGGHSSISSYAVTAVAVVSPPCVAGNIPVSSDGTCAPCTPGSFVKDYGGNRRECLPCPKNTANAATLSATLAQCVACARGTGTDAKGSTTCTQCPAGTFADVVGEGCKACSAGTSSSAVGAMASTTCAPCAAGTVQPLTGKTSCDACALGTSTNAPGGTTCGACPANAFTPQPGEPCSKCGELQGGGWYRVPTAAAGQSWGAACAKCAKGTATAAADTTACDACGPGSYADTTGLERCKSCPAGTAVATNGSVALADCVSCGAGRTSAVGSGTCSDCPIGTFGGAAVNPRCDPCPPNTFGDETKMQACKACPPGAASPPGSTHPSACRCGDVRMESGYKEDGTLTCACPRGTQIEGTECAACPIGTYQQFVGSQDCTACPLGKTTMQPGMISPSSCVCAAGFYQDPNDASKCLTCELLVGGACRGGGNLTAPKLATLPGHWRAHPNATTFHRCLNQNTYAGDATTCKTAGATKCGVCLGPSSWPGGDRVATSALPDHQCRVGYESRLCGVCSDGYSRVSADYECGECPSPGLNYFALFALFGLVVLIIAYLVTQTLKKKVGEKSKDDASILKVALNYLQIASFAAVVDFRWPAFMRDALTATSALSTPRSVLLSADCLLQRDNGPGAETFLARLGLALGIPPLLCVAAFAAVVAASFVPKSWLAAAAKRTGGALPKSLSLVRKKNAEDGQLSPPLLRTAAVCAFVTLFTIYPTVMQETLLLFSCKELDDLGESYLLESMDLQCGGSRHAAAVGSLGVPGLLVYVVGVPAGLMALLRWRRDDLHADEPRRAQELMWFVYGDYDPKYFFWEGFLMLRKALVVAFTVTMVPYGVEMQAHMVLGLLIVSFAAQIAFRPFAAPVVNTLEMGALGVLMFTFWVGLLNYDETVRGVPAAGEFLSVLVLLANVAFVFACGLAYSRASLAEKLGVDEDAPLRDFVGAVVARVRRVQGGGGRGSGGGGNIVYIEKAKAADENEKINNDDDGRSGGEGSVVVVAAP